MVKKQAGIRFTLDEYYFLDIENMQVVAETSEGETVYAIGSDLEYKTLYTNPDISVQMTTDTLFNEADIIGYEYLIFTVTDTTNSFEVKEWCEIEPLKAHSGQFVISLPFDGGLWCRKIYRSAGAVKPSAGVYDIGKTTENRNACIIKTVECVKGVDNGTI